MPPMGEPERLRRADHGDIAVAAQHVDVGVDVVVGGDCIEDEVEAAGVFGHLVCVAREHDLIGAEAECVFLLAGRGGEDNSVGSESVGELDAHVAQSTEADDAHLLALGHAPVAQRRVRGNAGAEQWSGSGEIEVGRNLKDEALRDDNAVRVAAIGDAAGVLVREVVGEGGVVAELLEAGLALGAGAVGVDEAADSGEVTGFEFGYGGADLGDAPDDLMAGNAGIDGGHDTAPLIASLVKIGVTDAAEENFDLYVLVSWIAPRDGGGSKRRGCAGNGICFGVVHEVTSNFPAAEMQSAFP